jgi:hypothetical protein
MQRLPMGSFGLGIPTLSVRTYAPDFLDYIQALFHSLQQQRPHLQVFHGASRTRTGDLLGAISAKGFAAGCRELSYVVSMRLRGVGALRLFAGLRRGYLTKT